MKKVLLLLFSLSFFLPATSLAVKQFKVDTGNTLTTGLMSYYRFEDAATSTDFWGTNDMKISGLTYYATTSLSNTSGNTFDWGTTQGNNNYMLQQANSGITSTLAIAFWLYPTNLTTNQLLWDFGVNKSVGQVYYPCHSAYQIAVDGQCPAVGAPSVDQNTWNFYVFNRTGASGTWTVYKNGTSTSYTSTASVNAGGTITFGNEGDLGVGWTGKLAEFGLWSKQLSAQEITDLYNSGNGNTMCTVGVDCPGGAAAAPASRQRLVAIFDD